MYKAMLVDDDVAVLDFLKRLIPWERLGFELAGEYADGLEAAEACLADGYPDVVVTDIGMPGLDGIGFIKQLQSGGAKTRYVILSCHDEFHYAQQAVQLGVQDYVLKETLSVPGMTDILARVAGKLEEDRRMKVRVERLHVQANKSLSAAKEKWAKELHSAPSLGDAGVFGQLEEFGLPAAGMGNVLPALFRAHRFQDALLRYRKEEAVKFIVENAAEELLREEKGTLFVGHSGHTFFLLHAYKADLAYNPYEYVGGIAEKLRRAFGLYLKLDYSVVVGEPASCGAGLREQLPALLEAGENLFYADGPVLAKAKDIEFELGFGREEDPFLRYFDYAEPFNRLLLEAGGDVETVVDAFVRSFAEKRAHPAAVKQFVWKLALDLMLKLKLGKAYDKEKVQQDIGRMTHEGELREWLTRFMREAVAQAERIAGQSQKTEIVDAMKFVRQHLNRKITLEEAAERLHLNPSYFSRLFKNG